MLKVLQLLSKVKALADPTRLKLLRLLMERECAVHELVDLLATGQSRISQHLAKLKQAGLVQERREGRLVYYSANPATVLGLDQTLLSFLYTPLNELPEMRNEWRRWESLLTGSANGKVVGPQGALGIRFQPAPAQGAGQTSSSLRRRVPRVLFLCTANSFRSQIAEAWTRSLGGALVDVQSAGLEPSRIHPVAEAVMREVGVEMTGQASKGITAEMLGEADVIVTLCGAAMGWFPSTNRAIKVQHWPFPDPASLGAPDEILEAGRVVRDGIRRRVEFLLQALNEAS